MSINAILLGVLFSAILGFIICLAMNQGREQDLKVQLQKLGVLIEYNNGGGRK